ncbi:MAG: hypothetical protein NWE89_16270, partial [Candidatus Bathyarchaeota archaeon]|nr:hypothetical protein [Candidatus Bathyarchaeota archaeon]
MTVNAGDILKTANRVVEKFIVKLDEDIEKGEIVYNDGSGILAAVAGETVGKLLMALEAHVYADETNHEIRCVVAGCVAVQKVSGSGAGVKGQKVMLSGTAGEVTLFVKGAAPSADTYNTATMQTA